MIVDGVSKRYRDDRLPRGLDARAARDRARVRDACRARRRRAWPPWRSSRRRPRCEGPDDAVLAMRDELAASGATCCWLGISSDPRAARANGRAARSTCSSTCASCSAAAGSRATSTLARVPARARARRGRAGQRVRRAGLPAPVVRGEPRRPGARRGAHRRDRACRESARSPMSSSGAVVAIRADPARSARARSRPAPAPRSAGAPARAACSPSRAAAARRRRACLRIGSAREDGGEAAGERERDRHRVQARPAVDEQRHALRVVEQQRVVALSSARSARYSAPSSDRQQEEREPGARCASGGRAPIGSTSRVRPTSSTR